jgi:hypothetical protein
MATVRKPYVRTKPAALLAPKIPQAERAAFINDLLDGTVRATKLIELPNGTLQYDDPQGA